MPSQSKSQQRFFGVVKAMQKGDIPKKGKAGKIAKQMSKKDVDDFASTKHKGKPEKVKREQRVRELIKKMVREIMAEDFAGSYPKGMRKKFDGKRRKQAEVLGYKLTGVDDIRAEIGDATIHEAIGKGMFWKDLKSGTSIEFTGGTTYVVTKIDKNKLQMSLKRRGKTGGGLFAPKAKLDKSQFESQVKVGLIKYLTNTNPRIKEGKLKEGKGVDKVLSMANDNSFGKLAGKTVDAMSANLFKKVYDKANDSAKEKINKMNEKQLYVFMTKLWSKFSKQVRI